MIMNAINTAISFLNQSIDVSTAYVKVRKNDDDDNNNNNNDDDDTFLGPFFLSSLSLSLFFYPAHKHILRFVLTI